MVRGRGKIRLWPAYFDASYTWGEGRRIPISLASRSPKVEELEKAAQILGLNPILEPGAAYSKYPWRRTGVVLVDKKGSKTQVLREIAKKLREL